MAPLPGVASRVSISFRFLNRSAHPLIIPHTLHSAPHCFMCRLALLPADAFTSVASFLTFDDVLPLAACSRSLLTVRTASSSSSSSHPIRAHCLRVSPCLMPPPPLAPEPMSECLTAFSHTVPGLSSSPSSFSLSYPPRCRSSPSLLPPSSSPTPR